MLNFDLMDTVAGKQLYKMGLQKGDIKAEKALRDTIFEVLKVRFGPIPRKMVAKIRAIKQLKMLKNLILQASQCPDIDSFQEKLS